MKRFSGLFAQVVRLDNLLLAARRAARGKRDRPTVARFELDLERELLTLQETLVAGSYRPGAFFTFEMSCAAVFGTRIPLRLGLASYGKY